MDLEKDAVIKKEYNSFMIIFLFWAGFRESEGGQAEMCASHSDSKVRLFCIWQAFITENLNNFLKITMKYLNVLLSFTYSLNWKSVWSPK